MNKRLSEWTTADLIVAVVILAIAVGLAVSLARFSNAQQHKYQPKIERLEKP